MIFTSAGAADAPGLGEAVPPQAAAARITPVATMRLRPENVMKVLLRQMATSVTGLGRHLMRRLSSAVIRDSATSATTASSAMPAKTPLASKLFLAL